MTVGAVVADTYKLESLIGRGGMGDVFAASHLRLPGKHVAIKFLHPEVADPEIVARFRREAEIASRLGHPNIVTVLDFNNLPDGTPYLVLEFLVGQTLDDALAAGPFSVERTLAIARQLCSALAAAHRAGIVHRDLKPQNIFLVPTEIEGRVGELAKILDFGISKIRGSQTVKTQDSALLGTPQYMSPEQATGQHDSVDGRTDIFALGAIFYEMLCGQAAFAGASIPEVVFKVVYEPVQPLAQRVPNLPPEVLAAIERAMQKKPDDRFATVGELVTALTGVGLATLPTGKVGSFDPNAPPSRKVSSADALAKTMGSGDHAEALVATAYERPSAAGTGQVPPSAFPAATAASQPLAAPPVTMSPPPAATPAGPGKWKWIAVAMAALCAAAIAFVIVRPAPRPPAEPVAITPPAPDGSGSAANPGDVTPGAGSGSGSSGGGAPPGNGAGSGSAANHGGGIPGDGSGSGAGSADGSGGGAGSGSAVTTPPPGKKPPRERPVKEPPPRDGGDDSEGLGSAAETLVKAWQAAEGGNDSTAKKLANSIIDSPDAPAKARSQAHQIIVYVACRADDRETAVRAAKHARMIRPKVIKTCADHDITLPRRR
jgi:eukaryotic-like serine/threonine-protein kinase